ncbi:hypothetical protein CDAR_478691 [Caerostris darwini]|uniref:Uncharacterized protein n=1 Tax=Caerostris darwini TaxID=1538125 RepID=A0AAV4PNU9_9ARAC|nr:hypothetical protein CDAR_478691 [Caerostris darwini]
MHVNTEIILNFLNAAVDKSVAEKYRYDVAALLTLAEQKDFTKSFCLDDFDFMTRMSLEILENDTSEENFIDFLVYTYSMLKKYEESRMSQPEMKMNTFEQEIKVLELILNFGEMKTSPDLGKKEKPEEEKKHHLILEKKKKKTEEEIDFENNSKKLKL